MRSLCGSCRGAWQAVPVGPDAERASRPPVAGEDVGGSRLAGAGTVLRGLSPWQGAWGSREGEGWLSGKRQPAAGMNKPHEARAGARAFNGTQNRSNQRHQPQPQQDGSRGENGPRWPEGDGGGSRRRCVRGHRRGTERCCAPPLRRRDPIRCAGCDGPAGALHPSLRQPLRCSPSTRLHGARIGLSWLCGDLPSRRTRSPGVSEAAGLRGSAL